MNKRAITGADIVDALSNLPAEDIVQVIEALGRISDAICQTPDRHADIIELEMEHHAIEFVRLATKIQGETQPPIADSWPFKAAYQAMIDLLPLFPGVAGKRPTLHEMQKEAAQQSTRSPSH